MIEGCSNTNSSANTSKNEEGCVTREQDWGDYKVGHLKTPLHKKLSAAKNRINASNDWSVRRRPALTTTSNLAKQYEDLGIAKKEMCSLQIELLKKQLAEQEKESKRKEEDHALKQKREHEEFIRRQEREDEERSLKKRSLLLDIQIKEEQLRHLQRM